MEIYDNSQSIIALVINSHSIAFRSLCLEKMLVSPVDISRNVNIIAYQLFNSNLNVR